MEERFHPVAELFPLMDKPELDELAEDIKKNGLLVPILKDKSGRIFDGRNRYLACNLAGVPPIFERVTRHATVTEVVALNLTRRHMTKSERARLAVQIMPLLAEEARTRACAHQFGRETPNRDSEQTTGRAQLSPAVGTDENADQATVKSEDKPPSRGQKRGPKLDTSSGRTAEIAGKSVGLSSATIKRAKYIDEHAGPELLALWRMNEISAAKAYKLAKLTHDEQAAALTDEDDCEPSDLLANPLPDHIKPAFQDIAKIAELRNTVKRIKRDIVALMDQPIGAYLCHYEKQILADASNVGHTLKFCTPYALCPGCLGDACDKCRRVGWMPKDVYERLPKDEQWTQ